MVVHPPGKYDALNYRIMEWNVHSLTCGIGTLLADAELDALESRLYAFFSDEATRRDGLPAIQQWTNRAQKDAVIELAVHKSAALIRSGHFWHMRFAVADLFLMSPQDLKHAFIHDRRDVIEQLFAWCLRAPTPMFLNVFIPIVAGENWDSLKGSTAWLTQAAQWPYDLRSVTKDRIVFWETFVNDLRALSVWISEWVPLVVIADQATAQDVNGTLDEWVVSGDTLPPKDAAAEHAAAVRWAW